MAIDYQPVKVGQRRNRAQFEEEISRRKLRLYGLDILWVAAVASQNGETQIANTSIVSLADLGFMWGAYFQDIHPRAKYLGLVVCPADLAVEAGLQHELPEQQVLIGMEPAYPEMRGHIEMEPTAPLIYTVYGKDSVSSVRAYNGILDRATRMLFIRPSL